MRYGIAPLRCMLSIVYEPFDAFSYARMRSISALIMASFPARVRGAKRLRGRVGFQAAISSSVRPFSLRARRVTSSMRLCAFRSVRTWRCHSSMISHVIFWVLPRELLRTFGSDRGIGDESRNTTVVLRS